MCFQYTFYNFPYFSIVTSIFGFKMTHKPKIDTDNMPTISQAKKWTSPDRFIYKGKEYEVDIRLNVKEVKPDGH